MRVPRFSLRRWMMIAGVVAIILALGIELERRRVHFARLARYHTNAALDNVAIVGIDLNGRNYSIATPLQKQRFEYHWRLLNKYERLASHPWWFAPADPPEPQ